MAWRTLLTYSINCLTSLSSLKSCVGLTTAFRRHCHTDSTCRGKYEKLNVKQRQISITSTLITLKLSVYAGIFRIAHLHRVASQEKSRAFLKPDQP